MNETLMTILSLSAVGSVLALILLLLKPLIKNRISKTFYYYLWLIVLVRLCLPFGVSLPVAAGWPGGAATGITDIKPGGVEPIGEMPGGNEDGANDPAAYASAPANASDAAAFDAGASVAASSGTPDGNGQSSGSAHGVLQTLGGWLYNPGTWLLIWAVGALLSLSWHVFGYIRFSGIIRRTAAPPDEEDAAVFDEMHASSRARFIRSDFVKTPMLIGIRRPAVVIPPAPYVQNGRAEALRDILRHELTHYRRRDLAYKWLAMLVASLHWFNPLMYLVRREIDRACELACDEAVISTLTPSQKQHYGETLMSLAVHQTYPLGILATTMCEAKTRLKERLVSIMTYKAKTRTAAVLSLVLLLVLAGCAAVSGLKETDNTAPPKETTIASPAESSPTAEREDVTLFEKYGLTVAIPNEYIDQLTIFTDDPEWGMTDGTYLISVYEKRSYEGSLAEFGEDAYAGHIVSLARYTRSQYEQFLASDGSGQSFFAKDDTYYYGWFIPTDVQFYFTGSLNTESEEWKTWEALNERCRDIKADFIARNHLTPYSDSEFWDKEFTYDSPHLYLTYYPYYAYQDTATAQGFTWEERPYTLILSQPAAQGDKGIWCVERWYDDNSSIYYEFPYESGEAAADYFAALQEAADSGGDTTLCDPVKAALAFARNRLGHTSATEGSFRRLEGEVAVNAWYLCRQVFDDMGTLEAALDASGNSTDSGVSEVPENMKPFSNHTGSRLWSYIWLKAEEPASIAGGAVICRSSDGSKTAAFYQQDSLLCIRVDGTEQWFSPAYHYSNAPYDGMRGLYEQFAQYNDTESMLPHPSPQTAADASNDIENLPKELYIARSSDGNSHFYAHKLQYSFDIEEAMEFTITMELARGNIQLSINNSDTDKTIFEAQDKNSINDTMTLEKGTYCVIISGSLYNGSIHIVSNQTAATPRD